MSATDNKDRGRTASRDESVPPESQVDSNDLSDNDDTVMVATLNIEQWGEDVDCETTGKFQTLNEPYVGPLS